MNQISVMRLVVLVIVLAGCPAQDIADFRYPSDGGAQGIAPECVSDFDCAPAGAKCCDCPTFAEPKNKPAYNACNGVACPMPSSCPTNVRAACNAGRCALVCVASSCDMSFADGFAVDGNGCLVCASAPLATDCTVNADCARVRADCCGCVNGGADTAVSASQIATHDAGLGCSQNPYCPGVDTCAADLAPQCIQGSCALISDGIPPSACGRPDLMTCATGTTCTINFDPQATAHGVGVCVPAT